MDIICPCRGCSLDFHFLGISTVRLILYFSFPPPPPAVSSLKIVSIHSQPWKLSLPFVLSETETWRRITWSNYLWRISVLWPSQDLTECVFQEMVDEVRCILKWIIHAPPSLPLTVCLAAFLFSSSYSGKPLKLGEICYGVVHSCTVSYSPCWCLNQVSAAPLVTHRLKYYTYDPLSPIADQFTVFPLWIQLLRWLSFAVLFSVLSYSSLTWMKWKWQNHLQMEGE